MVIQQQQQPEKTRGLAAGLHNSAAGQGRRGWFGSTTAQQLKEGGYWLVYSTSRATTLTVSAVSKGGHNWVEVEGRAARGMAGRGGAVKDEDAKVQSGTTMDEGEEKVAV